MVKPEKPDTPPGWQEYKLVVPFWIDTDAYTDRDRIMFCCGVEFHMVVEQLRSHRGKFSRPIHKENESRIRMAAGHFGRKCDIESDTTEWSQLIVHPVAAR